jgi:hypothetical protein
LSPRYFELRLELGHLESRPGIAARFLRLTTVTDVHTDFSAVLDVFISISWIIAFGGAAVSPKPWISSENPLWELETGVLFAAAQVSIERNAVLHAQHS